MCANISSDTRRQTRSLRKKIRHRKQNYDFLSAYRQRTVKANQGEIEFISNVIEYSDVVSLCICIVKVNTII